MNSLNHVAIIMDGNGRWGIKHKNSRNAGHRKGLDVVKKIIEISIRNDVKYLTLYTFSTENWKRPITEINYLFNLLEKFLHEKLEEMDKKKIKIKFIGNKNFSNKLNKLIRFAEKKTLNNKKIQVNLALNYGSRNEIILAIKKLIKNKKKN